MRLLEELMNAVCAIVIAAFITFVAFGITDILFSLAQPHAVAQQTASISQPPLPRPRPKHIIKLPPVTGGLRLTPLN